MLLCSTIFTICCVVHSNFCYFLFVQFLVLTLIIRAFSTMLNMCISYHTWCDVFLFCKFFLCAFSKIFRMCIYSHLKCCGFSLLSIICSTPNPYPSPIRPVGVSIIIVKIYYYSLSLLYYYSPVKHLCRKNSIAEPPLEISTSNFLGYAHIALT